MCGSSSTLTRCLEGRTWLAQLRLPGNRFGGTAGRQVSQPGIVKLLYVIDMQLVKEDVRSSASPVIWALM